LIPRSRTVEKIPWEGVVIWVQPRIRLIDDEATSHSGPDE